MSKIYRNEEYHDYKLLVMTYLAKDLPLVLFPEMDEAHIRASLMVGTLRVPILTHNSKYYFLYSHSFKSFLAPFFQNTL